MSSQTNLTTRRQFLERSAWGFGSAFLLPSLLTSCTDHIIPDPTKPPTNPPLLGDSSTDWNELIKEAVITGLGKIPEVGGLISSMIKFVWPTSGDGPWDKVRNQVQTLVSKSITDDDYNRVTDDLKGLSSVIADYQGSIEAYRIAIEKWLLDPGKPKPQSDIKTYWIAAYNDFDLYQPNFQQPGDEVILLPLFAQFANMYLALLRDAVQFGDTWGMNDAEIQMYQQKCADKITEFTQWVEIYYPLGKGFSQVNHPRDDNTVEPFRSTNAYDRFMTMLVLDYMDSWPYYNLAKYSNGATTPLFTREIYSDPFGNRVNVDKYPPNFALPSPATQFPTQLTVWGNKDIGAVQLTYPAGGGPNGATTTPRMGDQTSGNPNSYTLSSDQPILGVAVSYDYTREMTYTMVINTLQFTLGINNISPQLGQKPGQFQQYVAYDNYALSSIYIDGVDSTLGQYANCIVFGFKRFPH